MGGAGGVLISIVVGGLLAVGATFGLVSSQSATPPTVTSPYITYDS